MRRILPHELALHEALPWTVYDEFGNLLLREGYVIHQQRHLDSLFMRGAYVEVLPPEDMQPHAPLQEAVPARVRIPHSLEPVAARMQRLANSLERLHADVLRGATRSEMRMLVVGMAHLLSKACHDDADSLIGALHTHRAHSYLVVQQLLGAAVVQLLAQEAGVDEDTCTVWVCAALTRDLGSLDIQPELDTQTTPLRSAQRTLVQQHPSHGVRLLEQMGVRDPQWLQLVHQHHERCDGSGYPQQLRADAIAEGAKLLAVADAYAAMVTPRANRHAHAPRVAMRTLFHARGSAFDSVWVQRLLDGFTQYPPGSVVVLASGEHALVRVRQRSAQSMQVWAMQGADGVRLQPYQPRHTGVPGSAVVQAHAWPLKGMGLQQSPFHGEVIDPIPRAGLLDEAVAAAAETA